jgi:mannose-6-phosphate isomerase-like protein (cupin superfamily)
MRRVGCALKAGDFQSTARAGITLFEMRAIVPQPTGGSMVRFTIAEAVNSLMSQNTDYARLFEQNAFDIGIYRPTRVDPQTPHTRDELYIIAAGSGEFVCGNEAKGFSSGDVFFAPAGVEHRFMKFSDDFATWVVFIGPTSK